MRFDPDDASGLLPEWQSESQIMLAPAESQLWARSSRGCDRATTTAGSPSALPCTPTLRWRFTPRDSPRCANGKAWPAPSAAASTTHTVGQPFRSVRPEIDAVHVVAAEDIIDDITLRLHSQRPVTALGMAELRLLLADGGGPLYRYGRGDLRGRLAAAFDSL